MRIGTAAVALLALAGAGGRAAENPLPGAVGKAAAGRAEPTWVAWSVPQAPTGRLCCCCHERSPGREACTLEDDRGFGASQDGEAGVPARLEVFVKVEGGRVARVRAFSERCLAEAEGRGVAWLADVRPADSVAFLASLPAGGERLREAAMMAIAHHADPAADSVLEAFAAPGEPEEGREKAAFWIGVARGKRGHAALARLVREDRTDRFREHVVFALSVSPEPAAIDTLLEVARADASSRVRGQALFWLAQKAGRKATEGIARALEEDPETDVKKKAVFALSQLPRDEGVPLLLRTARTHRSPVVRREAIFWLGQSEDPRALGFFEEVLAP